MKATLAGCVRAAIGKLSPGCPEFGAEGFRPGCDAAKLGFKRPRGNGKRPAGSRGLLRGKVAALLSDLRLTDAYEVKEV